MGSSIRESAMCANFVVTADTERSYVRDYGGTSTRFLNLPELMQRLLAS